MAKKIPYGVSNFVHMMKDGYYYVDKTMYIPTLERVGFFLNLVRPRRFGKSLLLSLLEAYSDINRKDPFQKLFGNLYIGQHLTREQGTYQVMTLDFSQVSNLNERLKTSFNQYCLSSLQCFVRQYKDYYDEYVYQNVMKTTSAWQDDLRSKMAINKHLSAWLNRHHLGCLNLMLHVLWGHNHQEIEQISNWKTATIEVIDGR